MSPKEKRVGAKLRPVRRLNARPAQTHASTSASRVTAEPRRSLNATPTMPIRLRTFPK